MAPGTTNTGMTASNGDIIQVFPVALRFNDAEQFCTDFGGHLASIRTDVRHSSSLQPLCFLLLLC